MKPIHTHIFHSSRHLGKFLGACCLKSFQEEFFFLLRNSNKSPFHWDDIKWSKNWLLVVYLFFWNLIWFSIWIYTFKWMSSTNCFVAVCFQSSSIQPNFEHFLMTWSFFLALSTDNHHTIPKDSARNEVDPILKSHIFCIIHFKFENFVVWNIIDMSTKICICSTQQKNLFTFWLGVKMDEKTFFCVSVWYINWARVKIFTWQIHFNTKHAMGLSF